MANLKDQFQELMNAEEEAAAKESPLATLVCHRDFSFQLIQAGIIPWAALWWRMPSPGAWELTTNAPEPPINWTIDLPAWTKEELDVMLGPDVRLPQLPQKSALSRLSDPNKWAWFGANVRIDYRKGSDCSAAVLLRGVKEKGIKVEEANKRFLDVFQLVERKLVNLSITQVKL